MVTLQNYPLMEVQAARAVLLELAHLLGEYRQDVVLVGGWAPELLFPEAELPHVGSLDVDLALNHRRLGDAGYRTIHELLVGRGYFQRPDGQPFQYFRRVTIHPPLKMNVEDVLCPIFGFASSMKLCYDNDNATD